MLHSSITHYLNMLLHAEVTIETASSSNFQFNGTQNPGEYHRLLWQAESFMLPHMQTLSLLLQKEANSRKLILSYFQEYENILELRKGEKGRHRYLTISYNGQTKRLSALSRSKQQLINKFLSIQRLSFTRQRDFLFGNCPMSNSGYKLHCHSSDWIELGDALFQTGFILPTGTDTNEESFMRYFFEIFGHPLPPNYKRQLGQIRERNNPVRFLEKVRKDYLNKLSDLLKQKYCIIK